MHFTKQLAIFLDNRPGTLARVADALAEAKINIYAISTSDTVDHTGCSRSSPATGAASPWSAIR